MKKYKIISVLTCFLSISLFAQINAVPENIIFPDIRVGTTDSATVRIFNNYSFSVELKLQKHYSSSYYPNDTLISLNPNDSIEIKIFCSPSQNIIDRDVFIYQSNDSSAGFVLNLTAFAKYSDSFYDQTFNLFDSDLKNKLTQLIGNHTSLGYNFARDKMFMEIDNKRTNGQGASINTLEGVYTGRLAVGYTSRSDAQNNFNFNTEHTWPQTFFSRNEPMKSDLFHLYPTDVNANSVRGSYPFGIVVSGMDWTEGGSKRGRDLKGNIVFEPRDVHKGDVSRAMFYFVTRYPQNFGGFFSSDQEAVFRLWHKADSVTNTERRRNDDIFVLQHNRNPFIDHPEFVDRIFSFASNSNKPRSPKLSVLPNKLFIDSTAIGDTSITGLFVINFGDDSLIVNSISFSSNAFSASTSLDGVGFLSSKKIPIVFIPDSVKNYNEQLTINTNAGTYDVNLTAIASGNVTGVAAENSNNVFTFLLTQNYPNPFNPTTNINYQIKEPSFVRLKVYDSLGRVVKELVNEFKTAGSYSIRFNATGLSSGIYFYSLQAGNFISTKSMVLLK